jgi:hypothetical protein
MTNIRFSIDLENPNHLKFSETLFDPSEFLTHIMLDVIFRALHEYFVYQEKHAYL